MVDMRTFVLGTILVVFNSMSLVQKPEVCRKIMKMQAEYISKTLTSQDKATRRHNTEGH
jgi:hypothetical protein